MIKTSSYSDTGGRDHNEDFVCISASGVKLCAVVADGLGGHGGERQPPERRLSS